MTIAFNFDSCTIAHWIYTNGKTKQCTRWKDWKSIYILIDSKLNCEQNMSNVLVNLSAKSIKKHIEIKIGLQKKAIQNVKLSLVKTNIIK